MVSRKRALRELAKASDEIARRRILLEERLKELEGQRGQLEGATREELPQRRFGQGVFRVKERQQQVLGRRGEAQESIQMLERESQELRGEIGTLSDAQRKVDKKRKEVRETKEVEKEFRRLQKQQIKSGQTFIRDRGSQLLQVKLAKGGRQYIERPLEKPEDAIEQSPAVIEESQRVFDDEIKTQVKGGVIKDFLKREAGFLISTELQRRKGFDSVTGQIDKFSNFLESSVGRLSGYTQKKRKLDTYKTDVEKSTSELNQSIDDFNVQAGKGVSTEADYNRLLKQQQDLINRQTQIETSYTDYTKQLDKLERTRKTGIGAYAEGFTIGAVTAIPTLVSTGLKVVNRPEQVKDVAVNIARLKYSPSYRQETAEKIRSFRPTAFGIGKFTGEVVAVETAIKGIDKVVKLTKLKNLDKTTIKYKTIKPVKPTISKGTYIDLQRNKSYLQVTKATNTKQILRVYDASTGRQVLKITKPVKVVDKIPQVDLRIVPKKVSTESRRIEYGRKLFKVPETKVLGKRKITAPSVRTSIPVLDKKYGFLGRTKEIKLPKPVQVNIRISEMTARVRDYNRLTKALSKLPKPQLRVIRITPEKSLKFKYITPKYTTTGITRTLPKTREITSKSGSVLIQKVAKTVPKAGKVKIVSTIGVAQRKYASGIYATAVSYAFRKKSAVKSGISFKKISALSLKKAQASAVAQASVSKFKIASVQVQQYKFAQPLKAIAVTKTIKATRFPKFRFRFKSPVPVRRGRRRRTSIPKKIYTYVPSVTARAFNIGVKVPKTKLKQFVLKRRTGFEIRGILK